jgi:hypothetical protein
MQRSVASAVVCSCAILGARHSKELTRAKAAETIKTVRFSPQKVKTNTQSEYMFSVQQNGFMLQDVSSRLRRQAGLLYQCALQ